MSLRKKILLTVLGLVSIMIIGFLVAGAKVYFDVSKVADKTYEKTERTEKKREKTVNLSESEPISILLLGIDTGDQGRVDQGRSDTMMVATVNPNKQQTTIVSIARDTYTEIVGRNTQEKINHAYAYGGAAMSMDTVQRLLDIPVDHYVSINMMGLKELVDSVGGIVINNSLEFVQDDYTFSVGELQLNGEEALSYSRMRYEDPNGDYGRQERQRKIVEAVVKKLMTLSSLTSYSEILKAMSTNVKTDLTFKEMKTLLSAYRPAFTTVKQDQLKGVGFMQDGVSYQGVAEEELQRVQTELKGQLSN